MRKKMKEEVNIHSRNKIKEKKIINLDLSVKIK